jgi:hypothetical protein
MQHAPRHDDIGSRSDETTNLRPVHLTAHELDVFVPASNGATPRSVQTGLAPIDGDDALEERSYRLEHGAIPGAGVHRDAAPRKERAEREQVRPQIPALGFRIQMSGGEVLTRASVSRPHDIADTREASFFAAQPPPLRQCVGHDGIRGRASGQPEKRARAVSPIGEEPGLPERTRVTGDVRLGLIEELRELSDGEFGLRGQRHESQPHRIGQQPIQVPAGICDHCAGHERKLYSSIHMHAII